MSEFDKVIGYKDIKPELIRIFDIIKNGEKYKALGVTITGGLLLDGAPGVGKTLMANCFIKERGRNAFICRKNKPTGTFVDKIKKIFNEANADDYWALKSRMENRVVVLLAGKAATEILFGETDTGVNDDLQRAFVIVRRFSATYCAYGFGYSEQRNSSPTLIARKEESIIADMERYYTKAKKYLSIIEHS